MENITESDNLQGILLRIVTSLDHRYIAITLSKRVIDILFPTASDLEPSDFPLE
jgi:hypothetical protein